MSELKIIKAYLPSFDADHNDILLVSHTKENYVPAKQIEVYLKSEADKYILKLKADLVRWESYAHLNNGERLRELIHHKFKRCLAMARWCERKRIDDADYRIPREKWDLYEKWHKRWLQLAEKFKPNKEAK